MLFGVSMSNMLTNLHSVSVSMCGIQICNHNKFSENCGSRTSIIDEGKNFTQSAPGRRHESISFVSRCDTFKVVDLVIKFNSIQLRPGSLRTLTSLGSKCAADRDTPCTSVTLPLAGHGVDVGQKHASKQKNPCILA